MVDDDTADETCPHGAPAAVCADGAAPAELLDADEVTKSLTGYDEIAISTMFRRSLAKLAQHDETMAMRALLFVLWRREGSNDVDAYRNVMLLPMGDVVGKFKSDDESGADDDMGEG